MVNPCMSENNNNNNKQTTTPTTLTYMIPGIRKSDVIKANFVNNIQKDQLHVQ